MSLRLFNTGSGKKEVFRPIKPRSVTIYVCGITPYDTTHLGHAFTYLSFDVLVRYLRSKGYSVNYAQNVTDIDDDIIRKAKEQNRDWRELGEHWTGVFLKDMKNINMAMPTHYVKATETMPRIERMIVALLKKGYGYTGSGNIYFDISKFPRYGGLSHFNKKQMAMLLRERGGDPDDPNKRNPLDFILWQKAEQGEPSWDADFGKGRPGWHIECSAMINKYLGERIDIHGGGRDLVFPHHESEIAQSESVTGKRPFVGCFMHTGTVMYMGEKMAKSLGNLVMVAELLKKHSPNAIRWLLLSHHYRKPWEYFREEFGEADRCARMVDKLAGSSGAKGKLNSRIAAEFERMMDDDMDTPAVLGMIKGMLSRGEEPATTLHMLKILGFLDT